VQLLFLDQTSDEASLKQITITR